MPRLTSLVLAGALCCLAVGFAQSSPQSNLPPLPRGGVYPAPPVSVDSLPPIQPVPPTAPGRSTIRSAASPDAGKPAPAGPAAGGAPGAVPGLAAVPGDDCGPLCPMPGMPVHPFVPPPPPPVYPGHHHHADSADDDDGGGGGLILWGETMWLRARRNDPVIFQEAISLGSSDVASVAYDADYAFAFRAGAGYLTPGGWLILGGYTHYDEDVTAQNFLAGNTRLTYNGPGQAAGALTLPGGSLGTTWAMRQQLIDGLLGTIFAPTDYMELMLGVGGRLAFIDQSYGVIVDNTAGGGSLLSESLSIDLEGAGPRVGTEARVFLLEWLSLYGRGYTSLLLVNRAELSQAAVADPVFGLGTRTVRDKRDEIMPVIEMAIGGELNLVGGRLRVGGGYEFNYWFNLGTSSIETANGVANRDTDISLDGAFVRVLWLW